MFALLRTYSNHTRTSSSDSTAWSTCTSIADWPDEEPRCQELYLSSDAAQPLEVDWGVCPDRITRSLPKAYGPARV